MSGFLKLTEFATGAPILVNPALITHIFSWEEKGTELHFDPTNCENDDGMVVVSEDQGVVEKMLWAADMRIVSVEDLGGF